MYNNLSTYEIEFEDFLDSFWVKKNQNAIPINGGFADSLGKGVWYIVFYFGVIKREREIV